MAPAQRKAQTAGVLFIPAGVAPPRLAAMAYGSATARAPYPAGQTHLGTGPVAHHTRRSALLLPPDSVGTDRGLCPATSLSRVPGPLSLPRLPRSLWGP